MGATTLPVDPDEDTFILDAARIEPPSPRARGTEATRALLALASSGMSPRAEALPPSDEHHGHHSRSTGHLTAPEWSYPVPVGATGRTRRSPMREGSRR
jgi:hypothetical protein